MKIIDFQPEYQDGVTAFLYRIWIAMGRKLDKVDDTDFLHIEAVYLTDGGAFWLLLDDQGEVVGTAGLRRWQGSIAELKRFYIDPRFRGQSGMQLLRLALEKARQSAFTHLRFDTNHPKLPTVLRRIGFYEIPPYYDNRHAVVFMEKEL